MKSASSGPKAIPVPFEEKLCSGERANEELIQSLSTRYPNVIGFDIVDKKEEPDWEYIQELLEESPEAARERRSRDRLAKLRYRDGII